MLFKYLRFLLACYSNESILALSEEELKTLKRYAKESFITNREYIPRIGEIESIKLRTILIKHDLHDIKTFVPSPWTQLDIGKKILKEGYK